MMNQEQMKTMIKNDERLPIMITQLQGSEEITLPYVYPKDAVSHDVAFVNGAALAKALSDVGETAVQVQIIFDTHYSSQTDVRPSQADDRKDALLSVILNPQSGGMISCQILPYETIDNEVVFDDGVAEDSADGLQVIAAPLVTAFCEGFNS